MPCGLDSLHALVSFVDRLDGISVHFSIGYSVFPLRFIACWGGGLGGEEGEKRSFYSNLLASLTALEGHAISSIRAKPYSPQLSNGIHWKSWIGIPGDTFPSIPTDERDAQQEEKVLKAIRNQPAAFAWCIYAIWVLVLTSFDNQASGTGAGDPAVPQGLRLSYAGDYETSHPTTPFNHQPSFSPLHLTFPPHLLSLTSLSYCHLSFLLSLHYLSHQLTHPFLHLTLTHPPHPPFTRRHHHRRFPPDLLSQSAANP